MFKDAFIRIDEEQTAHILKDINGKMDHGEFDPLRTVILACDLSFYPGHRLLDISDRAAMPVIRRSVIHRPGMAVFLDGTNRPVYEMNKKSPLSLDAANVCDYLRFFLTNVRGKYGSFRLVETVESLSWLEEPPLSARKSVGKAIEPVMIISHPGGKGDYVLNACMTYHGNLLRAEIRIDKEGTIEFIDQIVLLDGMPLLDDVLEAG